ncbi:SDR family oxidoreductase [Flavobacterium jejuense]|uniref:SDR family oxidoreductase n=1 Tax=Flavobacterium jejuense TaxID=1544455 RepID=A0ABX0IQW6_9FLAO|nr:SDR family oxidoreductase [Flavobacterium jejuense]NHN25257.1 SDR family oxidoreductase [Flavobacterium jejuense]
MKNSKTALITGANKGIGFETAKQLATLGYNVYLGSRNKANGIKAVEELNKLGITNVDKLEIDVANKKSILNAKEELKTKISHLDVLINNAGISGIVSNPPSIDSIDNVRNVLETNFFGAIQVTQHFLDFLNKSNAPRIVNVSSELGSLALQSDPEWEFYPYKVFAYNTSKTALNSFTVMLAHEFKDTALKINSVAPGYTATDLTDFGGERTPDMGAKVIVKYATLDTNGPTGKFFNEDGEVTW